METTVLKEIMAFLLGRKYYANVILTKGTERYEICSYIFRSRESALAHKARIETTLSFRHVETISFRSRNEYPEQKV